jgi:L-amino acid N-acyltransferase YncA
MMSPGAVMVRDAAAPDAEAIADIYNHFIVATAVTFEETEVPASEMARRMSEVQGAALPWLVALLDDRVVGYAYASPWRARSAYRFSVEITVYVRHDMPGRGIGSALYTALFERLKARGTHAVIGGITLPNAASVALHERFGMRKVAHFSEVGFKFGEWRDVGYWQREL